jgi:hypothetical protein
MNILAFNLCVSLRNAYDVKRTMESKNRAFGLRFEQDFTENALYNFYEQMEKQNAKSPNDESAQGLP